MGSLWRLFGPTSWVGSTLKMKILFIFSISLFSHLNLSIAQDDEKEIAFCPKEHPYEFNGGESCCDQPIDVSYDIGDQFCEGESGDGVDCPVTGLNCDNFFPVCNGYGSINGEGFPDAKYNTAFEPIKDENGVPVQIAHRVVFGEKEFESENSRKCLYWEDDLEQWRLGQCIAIGKNFPCIGFTLKLKDPRERCVVDGTGWIRACSEDVFQEAKLVGLVTFSSGASDVQSQTATASLSYVKTNSGSFKPKCKWKFRRGKFRCIKPRKRKPGKGKKKKDEEDS